MFVRSIGAFAALLVVASCTTGPDISVSESDTSVPTQWETDPDIRIATLDNGLTVYLRENETPGREAELRLVINAGSAAEGDGPTGLAHFLEHMMFNGTELFPANELTDALADFGTEFGADVNAYTTYDETVYTLSVPSSMTALGTGLDILREWLTAATLDPVQVEKERGVIVDEWRQSEQDQSGRIFDSIEQLFFQGSPYAGRDPIGTEADIASITSDDLRAFYDRWYRPEHAALVVVGDFTADKVFAEIEQRFADVEGRGSGGPALQTSWQVPAEPRAAVRVDPDISAPFVELTFPVPATPVTDAATFADVVADRVVFDVLATRLADDISRGELAAEDAYLDDNSHVRPLDAPSVLVAAGDDELADAAAALVAEVERLRRFGVSEAEVDRAAAALRSEAERRYDGRATRADAEWADEATEHFLTASPMLAASTEHDVVIAALDSLSVADVEAALARRLDASQPHFLIGSSREVLDAPDAIVLWEAAPDLDLNEREEVSAAADQLMEPPEPVEEDDRTELDGDEYSYLEPEALYFANGATVILNPEVIIEASVSLAAVSYGGLSVVPDNDVAAAALAPDVVTSSGVGQLDDVAVDQIVGATSLSLFAGLDDVSEYVYADMSTDDLEVGLQYLHQLMAEPRADQGALDRAVTALEPLTGGGGSDQDAAGYLALTAGLYGPSARVTGVPPADALASVTTADVERVWRDRFGDVSGWVFVLVGDFDMDDGTEFARRYIGTLAGTGSSEGFENVRVPPTETVRTTVNAGTGDKAQLLAGWWSPSTDHDRDAVLSLLATQVLDLRLVADVREELGATYSPSSYVALSTEPEPVVETTIMVTGDPAGMADLSEVIAGEVEALRTDGVTDEEFSDALSNVRRELGYVYQSDLVDVLVAHGLGDEQAIERYLGQEELIRSIEQADLDAFLARVMPREPFVEVTVLPG